MTTEVRIRLRASFGRAWRMSSPGIDAQGATNQHGRQGAWDEMSIHLGRYGGEEDGGQDDVHLDDQPGVEEDEEEGGHGHGKAKGDDAGGGADDHDQQLEENHLRQAKVGEEEFPWQRGKVSRVGAWGVGWGAFGIAADPANDFVVRFAGISVRERIAMESASESTTGLDPFC